MITVLARFEIVDDKEVEAISAVRRMADAVKDAEPGCVVYAVHQSQVNPRELYIYEVYTNEGAFDEHRKTEHYYELQAAFDKYLDRRSFNVELLNQVAGFISEGAVRQA